MNISDFKDNILYYARKISESTNNIYSPVSQQYGLTKMQTRILMELYKYESRTIGSLADGIYAAGANISAMCKRLESMGLLKRVRDREDERVVRVALTEKGNDIVMKMNENLNEKIFRGIGREAEDVFDDIIGGLQELNNLLQKIASAEG